MVDRRYGDREAGTKLDRGSRLPALADFAFDDFAHDEIRRLEELRLTATEDRIEALLRLGRHGGLVGELDTLVAAHPLRERLRGQSMLALYRSGRQADGLQAYRDGRRLLAGEFGLEPGPELPRLERAILGQDPAIEAPAPAAPPARTGGPEEHRRPPPGRRDRRRRLAAVLALLVVALAAAVLAVALTRDDGPAAVDIVAPAVVAIDPDTNRVVASIRVGSRPVTIAADEGGLWVGDAQDGTVTRIDPSRSVVKTIGIGPQSSTSRPVPGAPGPPRAASARSCASTATWAAWPRGSSSVMPTPRWCRPPHRSGWAMGGSGSAPSTGCRIDPDSGKTTARVDLGQSAAAMIAVGGGAVWATTVRRRAKRIEASSAQETAEFYAGRFILPVALDRSAAWVGDVDSGQLWKLDPVTGSTLLTSRAGKGSTGIALGLGAVWVASWPDLTLVRLDPPTETCSRRSRPGRGRRPSPWAAGSCGWWSTPRDGSRAELRRPGNPDVARDDAAARPARREAKPAPSG